MNRRLLALASLAVFLAAACSMLPGPSDEAGQQPKPCAVVYSVARCEGMTDIVAAVVGKNRDDVVSVAIVPDAPPEGVHLGAGWHIRVRLALKDGSTFDKEICGGVVHTPACTDDPRLEINSVIGAYRDIPEDSSPVPSVQPTVAEWASPIAVDAMSIPIDRLGAYEIALGEGSLPNGIWTTANVESADTWPDDYALRDGTATLELRSLEADGRPFDNYYSHGWRPGVERIRAVLRFDVLWFRRGATLDITNVRVD